MNLILTRTDYLPEGIFGTLEDDQALFFMYTLEHSYLDGEVYNPKIPKGTYTCVRGKHQLEHMTEPFETFEITGVPNHDHILFHVGNYNKDSQGCVLLGLDLSGDEVIDSRKAFEIFMECQRGVNEFTLEVWA